MTKQLVSDFVLNQGGIKIWLRLQPPFLQIWLVTLGQISGFVSNLQKFQCWF